MSASDNIKELINAVRDLQRGGVDSIAIIPLLDYLAKLETDTEAIQELNKLQHESNLAQFKAENDRYLEMFRSVYETAKTALTTSILVNGGASVALLSFMGNAQHKGGGLPVSCWIISSLIAFSTGVIAGAVATGTTYTTQYCYANKFMRSAISFHILSIGLVVGSYVAFIWGIISAYHGFLDLS